MTKTFIPDSVRRVLQAEYTALVAKRAELVTDLDHQISEIHSFLHAGDQEVVLPTPFLSVNRSHLKEATLSAREITKRVVEITKQLLEYETHMKTPDIFKAIKERGVVFTAANPEHRLIQILSTHKDIFNNDRDLGWSLKGESHVPAWLSGATQSSEGENPR